MEQLVVCGWEHDERALLQALREHAALETIAVGDARPANLVRARTATRLACFQHLREMVREQEYDALLLAAPTLAQDVATVAAVRGADLIVLGDRMDAEALDAAATAAHRHGGALAVLRPMLRNAGYSFITDLVASESRWTPDVLSIEAWDERPAIEVARDLVAAAVRLMPTSPREAVTSAAGSLDTPSTIAVHVRGADGSMTTLTAHGMAEPRFRLHASTPSGSIDLDSGEGESRVTLTSLSGERERTVLRDLVPLTLEAQRVARIRAGEAIDARFAPREAALLRAIEESTSSGAPVAVVESSTRAILRLLTGGAEGRIEEPRRPHRDERIHVVAEVSTP